MSGLVNRFCVGHKERLQEPKHLWSVVHCLLYCHYLYAAILHESLQNSQAGLAAAVVGGEVKAESIGAQNLVALQLLLLMTTFLKYFQLTVILSTDNFLQKIT